MQTLNPLVSILIPTRNRSDLLEVALQSVKKQTYANFEVLVVDDGSAQCVLDEYTRIWKALDDRFRLLTSRGPEAPATRAAATRNRGLREARGDLVAFLDSDDEWLRADHLEVGVRAL